MTDTTQNAKGYGSVLTTVSGFPFGSTKNRIKQNR